MHNIATAITGKVARAICAIPEPRHKQIERRIEMIVARLGGRFTDSVEREILQQVLDGYPALGSQAVATFDRDHI